MSNDFNHLFDHQEQICYVQCGYCTTLLLVNVPYRSLSTVVTVKCGHCTSLLSVNMTKASFLPYQFFASLNHDNHELKEEVSLEDGGGVEKNLDKESPSQVMESEDEEDEDVPPVNQVINKPPGKKQRAPSAYNCFIREEIQRLKAAFPNMSHKQAFSTAAKNWAYFPPCQKEGEKDVVLI